MRELLNTQLKYNHLRNWSRSHMTVIISHDLIQRIIVYGNTIKHIDLSLCVYICHIYDLSFLHCARQLTIYDLHNRLSLYKTLSKTEKRSIFTYTEFINQTSSRTHFTYIFTFKHFHTHPSFLYGLVPFTRT
jgi:hypothetical protein